MAEASVSQIAIGYEVLVSCNEKLVSEIAQDPKRMAGILFQENFISSETNEKINQLDQTKTEKARMLVRELQAKVKSFPGRYDKFIEVIGENLEWSRDLLQALQTCYTKKIQEQVIASADQHQADSDSTDSGTHDRIDDLDSLQTHFKCPCGSTDFSHCVDPPPKCLTHRCSDTHGFPELDLTLGLDRKQAKSAMQQYLSAETDTLMKKFVSYGMAVYRYAKSIEGLDSHLKQMLRLQGQSYATLRNFDDLYDAVTQGTDFLNFEQLKLVLEECNQIIENEPSKKQSDAIAADKMYQEAFRKFAQLRVFSFVGSLRELHSAVQDIGGYKKLKIKIEEKFRDFIVDRIYHFKKVIKEVLKLPSNVFLRVTDVKEGCIEITFEIIYKISEKLFVVDDSQKRVLAYNGISMMEFAGRVYYCCSNLVGHEGSDDMIKKLYHQEHNINDPNEEEHSPDCPHFQDNGKECPLEQCRYCGVKLLFCILELHNMICDQRMDSTSKSEDCEAKHQEDKVNASQSEQSLHEPKQFADHKAVTTLRFSNFRQKRRSSPGCIQCTMQGKQKLKNHPLLSESIQEGVYSKELGQRFSRDLIYNENIDSHTHLKAECSNLIECEDGFAFRFEIPKEDLSLLAILIKDGTPTLVFKVAKKVPTISESDVATCIRLSLDYKRPGFFYTSFLHNHPLAGAGRHYKHYKPHYLRRTSIGETLANLDWHMKCLHVGVRGDKERGIFRSWAATSNLEGLASRESFPQDSTEPSSVFMTCKEACTYDDGSKLVFVKDPKIAIDQQHNPGYSNYITQNFDSIAYYDEPLFFKMKEIIKLILAAEWLRDKGVQFSKKWLEEHASNLQDTPKPLQVELSDEQIAVITEQLQQGTKEAFRNPALKQPSLSLSKFRDRFSVTQSITQVKNGCIEANVEKTFADPYLETTTELYVPVVQKLRFRASVCDLDFVYKGMDPNMPVTKDAETGELVKPDVETWSELYCETEPFPCKWLQDPNDPNLRRPALTGGVSTSSIPVRNVSSPVSVPSKSAVRVKATKEHKKQRVRSRDIPSQPVVNAPTNDVHVCSIESQRNAVARGGAQEMYGHKDLASCYGASSDGKTVVKQPSLHCNGKIVQLVDGKEVGTHLRFSMHLRLPPQKEPGDSAYSSIASTPSSSSQQRGLSEAQFDKDDHSSVTSDSGVSTATLDTLCNSDSDDTQADYHMDTGN